MLNHISMYRDETMQARFARFFVLAESGEKLNENIRKGVNSGVFPPTALTADERNEQATQRMAKNEKNYNAFLDALEAKIKAL
jgi:hypothetical protein